jgi:hypothetical protein
VKIGVAADDQEFSGIGAANRDFAWAAFIHPPTSANGLDPLTKPHPR